MEWVEITAKSIDEARSIALDRLGVAEDDADIEVLAEPRTGLFGRIKGEARVRARVRPTLARQKVDRRDRRRGRGERNAQGHSQGNGQPSDQSSVDGDDAGSNEQPRVRTPRGPRPQQQPKPARPARQRTSERAEAKAPSADRVPSANRSNATPEEQEMSAAEVGDAAATFLDGLVTAFGLAGTSSTTTTGDEIEVRVDGDNLGLLVGPRGTTLQAVQDLTRVAAQRRLGDHDTRLRIDIGGYRERRHAALHAFAMKQADEVSASGVARVLEPMSSADRKAIHDALSTVEAVVTRSEGEDPYRRVIIAPAAND